MAVIGAGNTAIDAANAARRLGAEDVSIVYRRKRESMSAFEFEYEHAKQEGVRFLWQTVPVRLSADGGMLEFLECARVDDALRPVAGSEFSLACDLIITAIGQSPLLELLESVKGVALEKRARGGRAHDGTDDESKIFCRRRLRERRARGGGRGRRWEACGDCDGA